MTPVALRTPFVGRGPLVRRLERMARSGEHALLVGPPGVGKSALLGEVMRRLPMIVAPRSTCLGHFLAEVEPQIGLEPGGLKMPQRVRRIVEGLPRARRALVLDNVQRVPPRLANLLRVLLTRQTVWLVARSVAPMDLGHVWPILFFFRRIDVPPFSTEETRAFLASVDYHGDRSELLGAALRLHRLAAGHPGTLAALVAEAQCRTCDLRSVEGLRLLALHARINDIEARLDADDLLTPAGGESAKSELVPHRRFREGATHGLVLPRVRWTV